MDKRYMGTSLVCLGFNPHLTPACLSVTDGKITKALSTLTTAVTQGKVLFAHCRRLTGLLAHITQALGLRRGHNRHSAFYHSWGEAFSAAQSSDDSEESTFITLAPTTIATLTHWRRLLTHDCGSCCTHTGLHRMGKIMARSIPECVSSLPTEARSLALFLLVP